MLRQAYLKGAIRLLSVLFSFLILMSFNVTAFSSGSTENKPIKVLLNGKALEFDVNPYIKGGRTLVPFRKIFEEFGMKVDWNETNKTVYATSDTAEIYLKIDDSDAYVNDKKYILDVPPEINGARTFVPLRFVGESLGSDVQWDGNTMTVTITKPDNIYALGQTAKYKDLEFSIDKINLDLDNYNVQITGKTNKKDKKLYIYLYETSNKYLLANSYITGNSNDVFTFEATSSFSSLLNFKKINSIDIKVVADDNKIIKIASYQP